MFKYLIIFILFLNCKSKKPKELSIVKPKNIDVNTQINYDSCKKRIDTLKLLYKNTWDLMPTNEKSKIFTEAIIKTIVPAWIGTKWAYNGTTETPQKGNIACGYFVTTVLRDAGLSVARVRLAQCASEEMIKTLVGEKYITRFSNVDFKDFISFLLNNTDGLYVVGLDNHTGFILKDQFGAWFIHSTFIGSGKVQKEDANHSSILKNSNYKIVGKISGDDAALKKWIKN